MTGDVTSQSASRPQSLMRKCSRTACARPAVATLTYVYSDSTAVVGPLATYAEPHTYDLCTDHAERLTPPRGWDIVRLSFDGDAPAASTGARALCMRDDLSALVDAIKEPAPTAVSPAVARRQQSAPPPAGWETGASRGHLRAVRMVPDPTDA